MENKTASLKEELDRAHRELAVLYEVSKAIQTSLELNYILHTILTGVTAHTGLGFNRAILFLVNTKERCLEARMAIGPESGEHAHEIWDHLTKHNSLLDDLITEDKITRSTHPSSLYQAIKNLKIPLKNEDQNQSLLTAACHNGQPVHISPREIKNYEKDPLLQFFKTNELILVPLKAKDKVNGIIVADNLYTQKPIRNIDIKIFMMIANQAGLAIENARLYNILRHKSHTDSLTRLWNHGFFQDQLSTEIDNAQEHQNPLSLIMMDLDNFKKLNDTHGHHTGDIVLKEISKILRESSRTNDYACRYGGEEFAIILTQTTKEQGLAIAERIRERVEQHVFEKLPENINLKVTLSIGLATYPHDATSKETLIPEADRAMYKAKFSGKNQVFPA